MKKYFGVFLFGFIFAQISEYGASYTVDLMQKDCYHFWTDDNQEKYQQCMNSHTNLKVLESILGYNFVYNARKIFD